MKVINLYKASSLPISFKAGEVLMEGLSCVRRKEIGLDDMKDQLLNSAVSSPRTFYYQYCSVDYDSVYKKKAIKMNIFSVFPDVVGIEFIKTRGRTSDHYPIALEAVYGRGFVLMQHVDSSDVVLGSVKKGTKIIVPPRYTYVVVNVGTSHLVFLEIMSDSASISEKGLEAYNGMSYYVIRKNGKYEIVQNPRYRLDKCYSKVVWNNNLSNYKIKENVPLLKQIMQKNDNFKWLFKEYKTLEEFSQISE